MPANQIYSKFYGIIAQASMPLNVSGRAILLRFPEVMVCIIGKSSCFANDEANRLNERTNA